MKRVLLSMLVISLAVVLASPAQAEDKDPQKKAARQQQKGGQAQVIAGPLAAQLEKANLTDEQKKQIEALKAKYAPKVAEARQAINAVMTREVRQARNAAMQKARAEGKKGAELKDAVAAAVSLTDDQKKALAEGEKALKETQTELRKEVLAVLTTEQKDALGLNKPAKPAKGEKKKKKEAA